MGDFELILDGFEERRDGLPFVSRTDSGTIRVIRVLSETGGAKVFLGKHQILGDLVEIHQAGPDYHRPAQLRRFIGEAQVVAQLAHPCIQPILGVAIGPDRAPALITRHVPGQTLTQFLARAKDAVASPAGASPEYGLARRLEIGRQIAGAVAHAHQRGVLHRDVKPDSVWIGDHGEVFLENWGIAKILGQDEDPWPTDSGTHQPDHVRPIEVQGRPAGFQRTRIGTVIGTPAYMAPEQAAGHVEDQAEASDVFSLGLLIYELICLQPAYGDGEGDTLARARTGQLGQMVAMRGEDISWEMRAVIAKATEMVPSDRYANASQLEDDLRCVLYGQAVSAAPDGPIQSFQRWLSQHRRVTFALLWLLMLLGLLGLAWGHLNTEQALALAEVEARIEEEALGAFAMSSAERGAAIELEFGLLAGEVRGWGASLIHVIQSQGLGTVGVIDARGARSSDDLGVITDGDGRRVPAYFAATDNLSRDSRELLFRVGRHWSSWTGQLEEEQDTIMRSVHRALRWSYVILATDGLVTMYPGSTKWHAVGDFRLSNEYVRAQSEYSLVWLDPRRDRVDGEPLLGLMLPLRSSDETFLGVFGVDIPLSYVRERLLGLGRVRGASGAYLLDSSGMIILDTSVTPQKPEPGAVVDLSLDFGRFEVDEVVRGVRQGRSGVHRTEQGTFISWLYLADLGWAYVAEGDAVEITSLYLEAKRP